MLRRTGSVAITASQAGRIAPVPLHAGPAWQASSLPRIRSLGSTSGTPLRQPAFPLN
jgi:hypothetical protein